MICCSPFAHIYCRCVSFDDATQSFLASDADADMQLLAWHNDQKASCLPLPSSLSQLRYGFHPRHSQCWLNGSVRVFSLFFWLIDIAQLLHTHIAVLNPLSVQPRRLQASGRDKHEWLYNSFCTITVDEFRHAAGPGLDQRYR